MTQTRRFVKRRLRVLLKKRLFFNHLSGLSSLSTLFMCLRTPLFFALLVFLSACQMPALPATNTQDEEGLFLKNVRFYSVEDNQLRLFGHFAQVRFWAKQRLLKSTRAEILEVTEQFRFQTLFLQARLDTQEAWASEGWSFQTQEKGFGEGSTAYAYKDASGNMFAQTEASLRLWEEGGEGFASLKAGGAKCEREKKHCTFGGAVETVFSKEGERP